MKHTHHLRAIKTAAKRRGITVAEYQAKLAGGMLWCTGCKQFHQATEFGRDANRPSGVATYCLAGRRAKRMTTYVRLGRRSTLGVRRVARDNDAIQARAWVNILVSTGRLPRPCSLPCSDCANAAREYDHHRGYSIVHHGDVEPVCRKCHIRREQRRGIRPSRASMDKVEARAAIKRARAEK